MKALDGLAEAAREVVAETVLVSAGPAACWKAALGPGSWDAKTTKTRARARPPTAPAKKPDLVPCHLPPIWLCGILSSNI